MAHPSYRSRGDNFVTDPFDGIEGEWDVLRVFRGKYSLHIDAVLYTPGVRDGKTDSTSSFVFPLCLVRDNGICEIECCRCSWKDEEYGADRRR